MEHKAVGVVGWDGLAQLLEGPSGGRMGRHVEMNNAARGMFHDHDHIQQPERRRHHDAEVTGDAGRGVILEKRCPTLISASDAAWGGGRLWQILPDRAWR